MGQKCLWQVKSLSAKFHKTKYIKSIFTILTYLWFCISYRQTDEIKECSNLNCKILYPYLRRVNNAIQRLAYINLLSVHFVFFCKIKFYVICCLNKPGYNKPRGESEKGLSASLLIYTLRSFSLSPHEKNKRKDKKNARFCIVK